jgi:8-oxo-dGTP diphosphatase
MGFIFNRTRKRVLLVKKKRPEWQAGKWNAIGGKIDDTDANPLAAMQRESSEETGNAYDWQHCVTFVCPGGTVFVYRAFDFMHCHCEVQCNAIHFEQMEDELLQVWDLDSLPANIDADLNWLLAVCLSTIKFPLCVHQNTLGEE